MRSEEPAGDHAGVRAQGLSAPITDSAAHTPPFEPTKLEEELALLGATHITLAGAMTNWCIRATAYGALERGYDLTLVKDAHTTANVDLGLPSSPA